MTIGFNIPRVPLMHPVIKAQSDQAFYHQKAVEAMDGTREGRMIAIWCQKRAAIAYQYGQVYWDIMMHDYSKGPLV